MARISDASIVSTGSLSEELLEISPNFREGSSSHQDAASPLKGRTVSNASTSSSTPPMILELPHELLSKILGYVPLAYKADSENLAPPIKKRKSFARRAIHSTTKRMTSIFRRKEKKAKTASTKNTSKKQSRESISDVCHLFRDIRMDYSNWKEWAKERGISIENLSFPEGTIDIQEECQKQIPKIIIEEVKKRVETLDKSFPIRKKMLKILNSEEPMKISSLNGLLELRDMYAFFSYFANSYGNGVFKSLPRLKTSDFSVHKKALEDWFFNKGEYKDKKTNRFEIFKGHTHLNLSNLQLSSLPECIKQLKHLKYLCLEDNCFSKLPDWIGKFNELELLRAHDNNLTELPDSFKKLTKLRTINLKNNNFSSLRSEDFKDLRELRALNLDDNKLSTLPNEFKELVLLKWLHLKNNAFEEFPKSLGEVPSLRTVDFSDNALSSLPATLANAASLEEIDLTNNLIIHDELPQWTERKDLKVVGVDTLEAL